MGATPIKCRPPGPRVCLTGPRNKTAVTLDEHCRFSAAASVVNKDLLPSSLEASVNINLRELSDLSGIDESIRR